MAFWSRLSGGVEGVYAGTASTLALVVSTGTAAPGSAGTLALLDNPNIHDLGHVAFRARLAGVAASAESGIWKTSGAGPTLGLVALEGAVAPGTRWRRRGSRAAPRHGAGHRRLTKANQGARLYRESHRVRIRDDAWKIRFPSRGRWIGATI